MHACAASIKARKTEPLTASRLSSSGGLLYISSKEVIFVCSFYKNCPWLRALCIIGNCERRAKATRRALFLSTCSNWAVWGSLTRMPSGIHQVRVFYQIRGIQLSYWADSRMVGVHAQGLPNTHIECEQNHISSLRILRRWRRVLFLGPRWRWSGLRHSFLHQQAPHAAAFHRRIQSIHFSTHGTQSCARRKPDHSRWLTECNGGILNP